MESERIIGNRDFMLAFRPIPNLSIVKRGEPCDRMAEAATENNYSLFFGCDRSKNDDCQPWYLGILVSPYRYLGVASNFHPIRVPPYNSTLS